MIDPELLLQGYRLGVFPMAMADGAIEWFSPDPRAILPLEDFHVPHVLRRLLRKKGFETKIEISRNHYLRLLRRAIELPRKFLAASLPASELGEGGRESYHPG